MTGVFYKPVTAGRGVKAKESSALPAEAHEQQAAGHILATRLQDVILGSASRKQGTVQPLTIWYLAVAEMRVFPSAAGLISISSPVLPFTEGEMQLFLN